ncbi:alpha/beta hydrolase fold domain-containing protein [Teichococcus oryzae]|uniref:Alpha/beta hydrolase fold domain-containing protein n=1 Tax=Teichococcus oryzae TaxID=1608942 RepID=A0A5B2TD37_9PROT|nr:alpha/beta hydrolase fold domain-containing protein [Pseudoroseomonas oryzae]KAA2212069.1 alpha/beta hydrolase fold domain-containing protein [Pseudoroseomonas oryzae]
MPETPPTLDPEVLAAQARLREAGVANGDILAPDLSEARAATRRYQAFLNEGGPEVPVVEHRLDTTPALRLRLYRPPGEGPLPAYLHIHGGGFAFGELDSLDRWKREIASEAGIIVVGLEYALAPEHPYPAAIEQVMAALRWLREDAASFGVDGTRLAVGGDSAGGNLALGALLRLRDAGMPMPRLGAIIYGMLSARHQTSSHQQFGSGAFGLSTAKLERFWSHYLPDAALWQAAEAVPLHAELSGLPPLLLQAAALDPLLDDSLALDERLEQAGVPHALTVYEGMPHGFIAQTAFLSKARAARVELTAALLRALR